MKTEVTWEFQINRYILVFCISAHMGWLYETIYTSAQWGGFAKRGFLQLPLCPIYGFGAVILLGLFGRIKNVLPIFLAGTIVTTFIEFMASYILEYIFHVELWTYRHWKYNFQGRIALGSSILFGVLTVLLIKVIDPIGRYFLQDLNKRSRVFMSVLIVGSILLDIYLCMNSMADV